ncbi:NfrA family protein [Variovorax sp. CY25R-8]|uniref:NfrA family protein n=1 Tax=Variovorax sp. CY25R-8 TaxID=2855501 RepID=UPI0021BA7CDE|nr:hypothetical protein [Variovorax sp. CY25R-8]MCT8176591.1 hypothetical protein [Variovorax sp. CY25R-8]
MKGLDNRTLLAVALAAAWPAVPAFAAVHSLPAAPSPSTSASTASTPGAAPAPTRTAPRKRSSHGRAWQLADQAFKAYGRGDFETALARADAALRLQPAAQRVHLLRVYALQKLGRNDEAARAAERAIDQGHGNAALRTALANLRATPADGTPGTEAYRAGFPLAAQAYRDYAEGRDAEAARSAEQAVRADPSQGPWVLLWLDALARQQRSDEIVQAVATALELGAPNAAEIAARVRQASRSIALRHAQKAYDALSRQQPRAAVDEAREAVRIAPDVASHRQLLIDALQAVPDLEGAEQATTDALAAQDDGAALRLQRAYLRQQLSRGGEAQQDVDAVIADAQVDEIQRRDARLIGVDLALAARDGERARALLAPLPPDDTQVRSRRQRAEDAASGWGSPATPPVTAYAPVKLCNDTPEGPACALAPWDSPQAGDAATRAYAAYAQKRYPEAIALAKQAAAERPDDASRQRLLTTTLAAGTTAERQQALQRLDTAIAAQPANATLLRQRGYLHIANKDPALALQDFVAARNTGQAPRSNLLDEAQAAAGTGDRAGAAATLRQAVDDEDVGWLSLDRQQLHDLRSTIASYSREWGVNSTVGYRGAHAASFGLPGQPVAVPGNASFNTTEVFWRPSGILNTNRSIFDVYGRLSTTLHAGTDVTAAQLVQNPCGGIGITPEQRTRGIAGLPSTSGALGVRYTPDTSTGLTFGLERQFMLGSATRSGTIDPAPASLRCQLNNRSAALDYRADTGSGGWQAYLLYGFYEGTGLRVDTRSWFTMEGYLQAGYTLLDMPAAYTVRDTAGNVLADGSGRLKRGQGFAAGEVRIGRSFVTDYNDRLVFFPHVTLAADWFSNRNRASGVPIAGFDSVALSDRGSSWSAGAGAGITLRYWFNEDRYNAQRSHVDASLQYRTTLGGVAGRAKGVFLNLTLSY